MMKWCAEAVEKEAARLAVPKPILVGVTILTSLSEPEIRDEIGMGRPLAEQVVHLASLANQAGLAGVVASSHEIKSIKKKCGKNFWVVTPGIRPEWFGSSGDQKRIMSPRAAFHEGADYIVIGRPIVQDKNPAKAWDKVIEEIGKK